MRMTTANKITIIRILLVPLFVLALLEYTTNGQDRYRWVAIVLFTLSTTARTWTGFPSGSQRPCSCATSRCWSCWCS